MKEKYSILKHCPFCGSTDIKYSEKTATINWQRRYRLAFYCNQCHCYGPRFLTEEKESYSFITEAERQQALQMWNRRSNG